MRGARSAGGLCALERCGLSAAFDSVFATSGGAVNGAYFLAQQAVYGTTIYYENLNRREFINGARLRKVVDVDYAIDRVITELKPLDVATLERSRSKLYACVTDADTGDGFVVDVVHGAHSWRDVLRATCALPILYNRPVLLGGRRCFDGGWWDHLPLQPAIEDGCTEILALLTEPEDFREKPPRLFERTLFRLFGHGANMPLWKSYHSAAARTNLTRDKLLGRAPLNRAVHVAAFAPTKTDVAIATWTKDAARLRAAAEEYAAAVASILEQARRTGP